jgi:hypothetical protein
MTINYIAGRIWSSNVARTNRSWWPLSWSDNEFLQLSSLKRLQTVQLQLMISFIKVLFFLISTGDPTNRIFFMILKESFSSLSPPFQEYEAMLGKETLIGRRWFLTQQGEGDKEGCMAMHMLRCVLQHELSFIVFSNRKQRNSLKSSPSGWNNPRIVNSPLIKTVYESLHSGSMLEYCQDLSNCERI